MVFPAEHMQLDHELHILAHGGGVISAGGDDRAFEEQAERTGDDDVAVEFVEQDAGGEKRPVVFQHLHAGQQPARHPVAHHAAVFDLRAVAGAHRPAHGDHIGILEHGTHDFFQRIVLQHRIRIQTEKIRVTGYVDAHIERIRLAAVFLANQRDGNFIRK